MNELHRKLIELHYELIHFYNNNNNKEIMSYLSQETSTLDYGVVKIGNNFTMTGANSDVLSLSNVVSVVAVPANSTSTGVGGQIAFNNDYIFYVQRY